MPMPPLTAIASGFADAIGAAYNGTLDQLLVVDCGNNTIVSVTVHTHAKSVVGTGYGVLIDLALSADGLHTYVVDGDKLLRLSLTNLNRAAATVVASGLGVNIAQLGLDEAHGHAYVVGGPDLGSDNNWNDYVNTSIIVPKIVRPRSRHPGQGGVAGAARSRRNPAAPPQQRKLQLSSVRFVYGVRMCSMVRDE